MELVTQIRLAHANKIVINITDIPVNNIRQKGRRYYYLLLHAHNKNRGYLYTSVFDTFIITGNQSETTNSI